MKQFDFDITIKLTDIEIEAKTEKEAREQLTESVENYFSVVTVNITEKEAKLVNVYDLENR